VQIVLIDEAVSVMVDHVEGLFELLDLVLVEHGEHIARGSLSTLLGGSAPGCCLSGRHF
jgi:hypothetical protein